MSEKIIHQVQLIWDIPQNIKDLKPMHELIEDQSWFVENLPTDAHVKLLVLPHHYASGKGMMAGLKHAFRINLFLSSSQIKPLKETRLTRQSLHQFHFGMLSEDMAPVNVMDFLKEQDLLR